MQTDFAIICGLMMQSDYHKKLSLSEVGRVILPALHYGQYKIFTDERGPCGFVTWAFLAPDVADGYAEGARKIQPGDWAAGDELWFTNFVAIRGGVLKMVREMYRVFPNHREAFIRRVKTGRKGRYGRNQKTMDGRRAAS